MTAPQTTLLGRLRPWLNTSVLAWTVLLGILIAWLAPNWHLVTAAADRIGFEPHAPDWALAMQLSWIIKLHILAALLALVIGTIILLQPKGSRFHKTLGWAWVIVMAVTAVSSLFIMESNPGSFSLIHIISGWTIVGLPMAIYAVRNKKVNIHRRVMTGLFVGGLIIAGALTFLPGRFFYAFFFA